MLALRKQRQEDISDFEVSLVYIGQPGLSSLTLSQKQQTTTKTNPTLWPKRRKNDHQPRGLAGGYPLSTPQGQCGYDLAMPG